MDKEELYFVVGSVSSFVKPIPPSQWSITEGGGGKQTRKNVFHTNKNLLSITLRNLSFQSYAAAQDKSQFRF